MTRPQLILSESARLARMRPTGAEMEGYAGPRPSAIHGVLRQEPEVVPSREGLASAGVPPAATPPDPAAVEARARRDGCDCQPWIERCVHFGDSVLVLADCDLMPTVHTQHYSRRRFDVSHGGTPFTDCYVCGTPRVHLQVENRLWGIDYYGNDPDAAVAAFDAAAERLRAGAL